MRGAEPKYLTCGFLLQEGLSTDLLKRAVQSMAQTAREAGVKLIAGDTKVIPGDGGLYINTAGVGFVPDECRISAACCRPGDAVLVSGTLGDHHAAILSSRLGIQNEIKSDCAPLGALVNALKQAEIDVHALRDITRGRSCHGMPGTGGGQRLPFSAGRRKTAGKTRRAGPVRALGA